MEMFFFSRLAYIFIYVTALWAHSDDRLSYCFQGIQYSMRFLLLIKPYWNTSGTKATRVIPECILVLKTYVLWTKCLEFSIQEKQIMCKGSGIRMPLGFSMPTLKAKTI